MSRELKNLLIIHFVVLSFRIWFKHLKIKPAKRQSQTAIDGKGNCESLRLVSFPKPLFASQKFYLKWLFYYDDFMIFFPQFLPQPRHGNSWDKHKSICMMFRWRREYSLVKSLNWIFSLFSPIPLLNFVVKQISFLDSLHSLFFYDLIRDRTRGKFLEQIDASICCSLELMLILSVFYHILWFVIFSLRSINHVYRIFRYEQRTKTSPSQAFLGEWLFDCW